VRPVSEPSFRIQSYRSRAEARESADSWEELKVRDRDDQQRSRVKRRKRQELLDAELDAELQAEDADLKANWPVQPSKEQQLRSIKLFRAAISFPCSQLSTCASCTRELFPDEGIRAVGFKSNAWQTRSSC
jgi:hypothetical protein